MVPHSHDDVGWLKTVDDYFYGNKMEIYRASVAQIIEGVFQELQKNPKRKYT